MVGLSEVFYHRKEIPFCLGLGLVRTFAKRFRKDGAAEKA